MTTHYFKRLHSGMFLMRAIGLLLAGASAEGIFAAEPPVRVVIIDGESNHDFRGTTASLRTTLASTRRFGEWTSVQISRSPIWWEQAEPKKPSDGDDAAMARYEADKKAFDEARQAFYKQRDLSRTYWRPPFDESDVAVVNYNGGQWPEQVKDAFVEFVRNGGGAVIVHSANNPFDFWPAYNEMLGIGWRGAQFGQWIAVDDATGKLFAVPEEKPAGSSHGAFAPFTVKTRAPEHPIMAGLPDEWVHAADELYFRMRGTPTNLNVLATAYSPDTKQHEPVIWWVPFGKGRVVTTSMGHYQHPEQYTALQCVGFQTVVARACEWAATGKVTIPVPAKFPTATEQSVVPTREVMWNR